MVIDTSALLAILQDEPERRRLTEAIEASADPSVSAATWVEASIVVDARYGADGLRLLDLLIDRAGIEVVAVDRRQADVARHAFRRFGKGRHPAGLNYGDCFSYALARVLSQRLLCKGDDFVRTDLALA
jgi:ribonuclease VapC